MATPWFEGLGSEFREALRAGLQVGLRVDFNARTLSLVPSSNSEEDMRPSALALGKGDSASQSLPRVCRRNANTKHVKDYQEDFPEVAEIL